MAGPTWSCTSRPRATSTARSSAPPTSCSRTCSARRCCSGRARRRHRAGSCTCRPTRCTARSRTGRWAEDTPLAPNSPYSASKAVAATCSPGPTTAPTACPCAITRCSNNYGPYQFPEKVIPLFVTNLLDGGTVPLYGDGAQRPRLAARRRPLPRHPAGARAGPGRRGLQHRRRHRADQPRADRPAARRAAARTGQGRARRRTARATTGATRVDIDQDPRRARLRARRSPSSRGWPTTVAWYRDNRAWWEPAQGAVHGSPRKGRSQPLAGFQSADAARPRPSRSSR